VRPYIDPYLEGGRVVKIAKQGENTWLQPEYASIEDMLKILYGRILPTKTVMFKE